MHTYFCLICCFLSRESWPYSGLGTRLGLRLGLEGAGLGLGLGLVTCSWSWLVQHCLPFLAFVLCAPLSRVFSKFSLLTSLPPLFFPVLPIILIFPILFSPSLHLCFSSLIQLEDPGSAVSTIFHKHKLRQTAIGSSPSNNFAAGLARLKSPLNILWSVKVFVLIP